MIGILIVTHGRFGEEMVNTAGAIIGSQENIKTLQLPSEEAPDVLKNRLEITLSELDQGQGTLIMTDMLGGTPCNICLPYVNKKNISIVSGVNLYMILTALINRDKMALDELTEKVAESGQKNIVDVKKKFLKK
ncbi:MAG: PTS sugar transporter subunit IIA [Elusimicrobiota bacterium]